MQQCFGLFLRACDTIISRVCFSYFIKSLFFLSLFSYSLDDPLPKKVIHMIDQLYKDLGLGLAADFFSWARHIPTSGARLVREMSDTFVGILTSELEYTKANYDPGINYIIIIIIIIIIMDLIPPLVWLGVVLVESCASVELSW